MKFHSLRSKLMLLFFVFFFVPYALLAFFSVSATRAVLKMKTMDHLRNLVEVKETAIQQWLRERISDGKTIAGTQEMRSLNPALIQPFLTHVRHLERSYLDVRVLNPMGKVIAGTPAKTSLENEEWFQKALREGECVYSPGFRQDPAVSTITIALAIKDNGGRPIGVLEETVNMSYVAELISESKLGETGRFFIVNTAGDFIIHPRLEELLKKGVSRVSYFDAGALKPANAMIYRDYLGREVLGWRLRIPGSAWYLVGEQNTVEAFHHIDILVKRAWSIFIVSAIFILLISFWVIGRITRPIKQLSKSAAGLAEGRFEQVIPDRRTDEIGTLITAFNVMAAKLRMAYTELEGKVQASNRELETAYQELKERQEQLVQSEKMAALGQLSAGIAHEIRNPVTSIKIFIQALEKEMDLDENRAMDFAIVKKEIDRINENITSLLNFARPEDPVVCEVDLVALVKETLNLLAANLRKSNISLQLSLPDTCTPIEGDRKQLVQVLLNLLLNAIEAMPEGGTLRITAGTDLSSEGDGNFLSLLIRDSGHGIPASDLPYLFDPFFSRKEGGTGLGLSIVYSIVRKHRGSIRAESEPGKGTCMILSLPFKRG